MTDAPFRRRDEGSALPLVLVLMVLGALIVVPMLSYTVTVLRANTVVVDANREREAAEANVRVALLDPTALFAECDGSAIDLVADQVMSDPTLAGTTRCDVASEVSALNALGFQTPSGMTATQLGASVPVTLTGERTAAPAGNTAEDWWVAGSRSVATDDTIWLPDLPTFPSGATRTATPYSMPAQFGCKVFLPGYYDQALTIDPTTMGTSRIYFASGVYYFDEPVTVQGAIDVVVGYGTESFDGSECADDLQVGGNLIGGPTSYGIDGVGATFVFGDNGRLVVRHDSSGAAPSLRFNQRYGDVDGGGRVSIMSVNGVSGDVNQATHFVDDVVSVPRSNVAQDDVTVAIGTNGQNYAPSSDAYTSKPQRPSAPAIVSADVYTASVGPPRRNGVLLVWEDVVGDRANGALVTAYTVTVNGAPANVCPPTSVLSPTPGQLACFVGNLSTSGNVRLSVTARNSAGDSTATERTVSLAASAAPLVAVPAVLDPATIVTTPYRDALEIDWPAAAHNGAVITGYDVVVERVYEYVEAPATTAPAVTEPTSTEAPTTSAEPTTTDVPDTTESSKSSTTSSTSSTTSSTSSTTTTVPAPPTTTVPPTPVEVVDGSWTCGPRSASWTAVATECIVRGLGTLDTTAGAAPNGGRYLGFRITVTAINGLGAGPVSAPTAYVSALGTADAPADTVAPARSFTPRVPTPIVEIDLRADAEAHVSIPGYVSIPMSRITVRNAPGHDVRINGGILAATFDITDGRAGPADAPRPSSLPIGYIGDIVLQRTLRVTSTVGRTSVTATVQVNENGEMAVNSWVVS